MSKPKKDKYKSARGGHSRILDISCQHCSAHVCFYQKDGPGSLKRMYLDRIEGIETLANDLNCPACARLLGVFMIYEKEQRPAYRLLIGSVSKKILRQI